MIIIMMMPKEAILVQEFGGKAVIIWVLMETAEGIYVSSHLYKIGSLIKWFKICSSKRDYEKVTLWG